MFEEEHPWTYLVISFMLCWDGEFQIFRDTFTIVPKHKITSYLSKSYITKIIFTDPISKQNPIQCFTESEHNRMIQT